ncbi:MAG TPA: LPXTG cell wall anchor domain-containing protein [Asanoa sp.]|nr:LPXTG cell wall anchor domain-containing protein [Asanoa sp.]
MFHIPTALRRPLAVAGAAVVGLAAAVAFGAPASAHHSIVVGTAVCNTTTGNYDVDWTITVDAPPKADHYRLVTVEALKAAGAAPEATIVPGIAATPDGGGFPHASDTPLTSEKYTVGGDTTYLSLHVKAKWNNGYKETKGGTAEIKLSGDCQADSPRPHAEANPTCEGLVITLSNKADAKKDAVFVIKGEGGFSDEVTVAKDGKPVDVTVPADKAGKVTVTEKNTKDFKEEFEWKNPGDCGVPEGTLEATCDSLTFRAENPADGREVKVTFTPTVGETVERTLKPGTEMEPVVFPGSPGLKVTVSSEGEDDVVVDYDQEKPADCGDTPTLPRTGANTGAIAGGAGGLLVIGAGLFFIARRRRLRFTA